MIQTAFFVADKRLAEGAQRLEQSLGSPWNVTIR